MPEAFNFDDIRPYYDEEIPPLMKALTSKGSFFLLMQFLFPEKTRAEITEIFLKTQTIREFQHSFSHYAVRSILNQSAGEITHTGIDTLKPNEVHTIVSNHRDIILDPAVLSVLLLEHGLETTQNGIGSNLLFSELLTSLMRLNKSFIVKREGTRKDLFEASHRLSAYIRTMVTQAGESLWIANRNGRTKDGNDQTQPGLMKMLSLSGGDDFVKSFTELKLLPMAISYEYEPCDNFKARETAHVAKHGSYSKSRDEDKNSMIAGMRNPKGRIHLALGTTISAQDLEPITRIEQKNDRMQALALLVDDQIYEHYKLWPTHYMAYDIETDGDRFSSHYTPAEKVAFKDYIITRLCEIKSDTPELRKEMLGIYSSPVKNRLKWEQEKGK